MCEIVSLLFIIAPRAGVINAAVVLKSNTRKISTISSAATFIFLLSDANSLTLETLRSGVETMDRILSVAGIAFNQAAIAWRAATTGFTGANVSRTPATTRIATTGMMMRLPVRLNVCVVRIGFLLFLH
jgi:hypothetical protein